MNRPSWPGMEDYQPSLQAIVKPHNYTQAVCGWMRKLAAGGWFAVWELRPINPNRARLAPLNPIRLSPGRESSSEGQFSAPMKIGRVSKFPPDGQIHAAQSAPENQRDVFPPFGP